MQNVDFLELSKAHKIAGTLCFSLDPYNYLPRFIFLVLYIKNTYQH